MPDRAYQERRPGHRPALAPADPNAGLDNPQSLPGCACDDAVAHARLREALPGAGTSPR